MTDLDTGIRRIDRELVAEVFRFTWQLPCQVGNLRPSGTAIGEPLPSSANAAPGPPRGPRRHAETGLQAWFRTTVSSGSSAAALLAPRLPSPTAMPDVKS